MSNKSVIIRLWQMKNIYINMRALHKKMTLLRPINLPIYPSQIEGRSEGGITSLQSQIRNAYGLYL